MTTPKRLNRGEKARGNRRKSDERRSRVAERPRRPAGYRGLVSPPGLDTFPVLDNWASTPSVTEAEVDLVERLIGSSS